MPELAAKLVALSNKATFAQDLLVEILNAGDYYTPDEIATYVRPKSKLNTNWDDVPVDIKNTFDKLGIP